MTKRQSRQYAMLVRVRDFGNAHQEAFPDGSEGRKAFAVITTAVADIDAFNGAKLTARRVSNKSKAAAKRRLAARIAAIARSARVLAMAEPGADEKFPLPTRKSDVAVLQTGLLFLKEAAPVKDAFIRCGLAQTFVEDLQQAVAAFEQAISGRSAGRASGTVAQKGIRSSLKTGIETVRALDALVANVLGHDATVMTAWKRDRHVDMAGSSASVGAPADRPVSLPEAPPEVVSEPVPAIESPAATAADQTELRRAS